MKMNVSVLSGQDHPALRASAGLPTLCAFCNGYAILLQKSQSAVSLLLRRYEIKNIFG